VKVSAWIEWLQARTVTEIGAAVGVVLGVGNTVWNLCAAYLGRRRLRIEVDWDCSDEDGSFPRITIRNIGGRTVYVADIEFVEANKATCRIATFDNLEIKQDQNFYHRPIWRGDVADDRAEITMGDDPEFRYGWEGLRIVVHDARGKKWRSRTPATKPSWFDIHDPPDFLDAAKFFGRVSPPG
jgi:hypothetical protein